jgi:hypothetical protein
MHRGGSTYNKYPEEQQARDDQTRAYTTGSTQQATDASRLSNTDCYETCLQRVLLLHSRGMILLDPRDIILLTACTSPFLLYCRHSDSGRIIVALDSVASESTKSREYLTRLWTQNTSCLSTEQSVQQTSPLPQRKSRLNLAILRLLCSSSTFVWLTILGY